MRVLLAAACIAFGIACVSKDPVAIKTQVVTFPEGAIVEFNGKRVGRAPAEVILPQDTNGKLVDRAVVRVVPNTEQPTLYAQSRVFEPAARVDRVPNRIMIDLTRAGTNSPAPAAPAVTTHAESATRDSKPRRPKPIDRGKPTQPVGIDRWNPGIY